MEEYKLPFKRGMSIIELGGGTNPRYRPNADIQWAKEVDIICDFNHPLPIYPMSYDGVYSQFLIEHLSWRKVRGFISEIYRILKPGGVAVLIAANLLEQARKLVETEEWDDGLVCMIFGDQNYPQFPDANAHHCGFSPEYAKRVFKEAGFFKVEVFPLSEEVKTDMIIEAHKSKARIT